MHGYVIRNIDECAFVAPLGHEHSFTKDILKARIFRTMHEAKRECCGNEIATSIDVYFRSDY